MTIYPKLDFARFTPNTLDIEQTLVVHALKQSQGQPTMSDEDVKLAILILYNTCTTQQQLIDELVDCVNEMRQPKKKIWKFWINLK